VKMFAPRISPAALCGALRRARIQYVILGREKGEWPDTDVQKSYIARHWQPVFTSEDRNKIYDVNEQCTAFNKE
jgi:hypothetical protein